MSKINMYFVLLDPKNIPQRISAGDLGREEDDWTLDQLLADDYYTDTHFNKFIRVNDKVAYQPLSKEYDFLSSGHSLLSEGWVELAVEATSISEALNIVKWHTQKVW
jgi:hypothetical protein